MSHPQQGGNQNPYGNQPPQQPQQPPGPYGVPYPGSAYPQQPVYPQPGGYSQQGYPQQGSYPPGGYPQAYPNPYGGYPQQAIPAQYAYPAPQQPAAPQNFGPKIDVSGASSSVGGGMVNYRRAAMKGKIRTARILLMIIGILTVGFGALTYYLAPQQVDREIEIRMSGAPQARIEVIKRSSLRDNAVDELRVASLLNLAVGAVLLLLASLMHLAPVPTTGAALVVYGGAYVIAGLIDSENYKNGTRNVVTVIVVVCLIKAFTAALAYQQAAQLAATANPGPTGYGR